MMIHKTTTTLALSVALNFFSGSAFAADAPTGVTWGAFVDGYYAYDFNRPSSLDRSYTTQPSRHNEFNINLAYIEGKIDRENVHGRLALQAGTSVLSNYSGEPAGSGSLARHIQEAYVGYRLGGDTWIDAGIMFAHIGLESFISKDNMNYTRSLVADYSPYYETGIRLSTKFNDQFSGQLLVLNGWQNISETNENKALGTQLAYTFSPEFTVIYNTFLGRESSFRHFHDVIVKYSSNEFWSYALQADLGFQDEAPSGASAQWNGFTLIAKHQITKSVAIIGRVERYSDPKQAIINAASASLPTGTSFQTWGGSIGVDTTLDTNVWWRNEIRGYWAKDEVFTSSSGFKKNDGVIVSSISAAF